MAVVGGWKKMTIYLSWYDYYLIMVMIIAYKKIINMTKNSHKYDSILMLVEKNH